MLKLYENNLIDREKWDNLIDSSSQGVIYAKSWYLDILFPAWKALITEKKGVYIAGAPFCPKSRFFIRSVHHPYLSQQLGLFTREKEVEATVLDEIITFWKNHYHYVDYFYNVSNTPVITCSRFFSCFFKRVTYHLHLAKDYNSLKTNFSKNTLRNLKKASVSRINITEEEDFNQLITLFRKNKGAELNEVKDEHYSKLREIIRVAKTFGYVKIVTARDDNGVLISGALFLIYKEKIIYLFGSGSDAGRNTGAFPAIFDTVIREFAETDKTLDFEGSEIPGLARFYSGFGASPFYYYAFHLNKIKWLLKVLKIFR